MQLFFAGARVDFLVYPPPFPSPDSSLTHCSVLVEILVQKIQCYKLCENRRLHRMIPLNVLTEILNIYYITVKLDMRKSLESRWCLFCYSRNHLFLME